MKKQIFISMIVITAMGIIGCSNDGFDSAFVTWNNQSGQQVHDIKWEDESGNVNTSWIETVADTNPSSQKEVTLETGTGRCFFEGDGLEEIILINDAQVQSYTLSDGSSEVLKIAGAAKK